MTTHDTRRRATARRETGSRTMGPGIPGASGWVSSVPGEGRQELMNTITQDREAARHREAMQDQRPLRAPLPRQVAGGPFRADTVRRPASAQAPTAPSRRAPDQLTARRPAARGTGPAQPAAPSGVRLAGRAGHLTGAAKPRMRFALLVLVLLGGGLVCLLVINTTLGATSFRISQLQSSNADLQTQEQVLQQQIAAELSPALIARRAYQLGMRVESNSKFLDLRTHRIDKLAAQPGATVPLGSGP